MNAIKASYEEERAVTALGAPSYKKGDYAILCKCKCDIPNFSLLVNFFFVLHEAYITREGGGILQLHAKMLRFCIVNK